MTGSDLESGYGIGTQGRQATVITGTRTRVDERMRALGLSIPNIVMQLKAKTGSKIVNQNIYNWMIRDSIPAKYLNPLADILKCNSEWLRTGEENLTKTNINAGRNQLIIPIFDAQTGSKMYQGTIKDSLSIDKKMFADMTGLEPADNYIIVTVKGDTMQPLLRHGDMCIVDTEDKTPVDGVFYVQHGESAEIKRVSFAEDEMSLISDNNRYPIKRLKYDKAKILGRVMYCFNGSRV